MNSNDVNHTKTYDFQKKKKSMKAHLWGMNSLYKNVQIKLYKFI